MQQRNYYSVLGLRKSATLREIKSRFRQLALRYHPDRNPKDPSAEEEFKLVAEAYHVLSNRQRRRLYDDKGYQELKRRGYQGFRQTEDVLSTLASEFFDFLGISRSRSQRGPLQGADLCYELGLTFDEAATGVNKTVEIIKMETCSECKGLGAKTTSALRACPWCGGSGKYSGVSGIFRASGPCPKCNGDGNSRKLPCSSCTGEGRRQMQKALEVHIPAGVEDNARLKIAHEGDGGEFGAASGDLYLLLRIRVHP